MLLVRTVTILTIFAAALPAAADDFAGLTPGKSTGDDAVRALGEPTRTAGELKFAGDDYRATQIIVQVDQISGVIQSISLTLADPPARAQMAQWMQLGDADFTRPDGQDEIQSYLPQLVELRVRGQKVIEFAHLAPKAMVARCEGGPLEQFRKGDRFASIKDLNRLAALDPANAQIRAALATTQPTDGHGAGRPPTPAARPAWLPAADVAAQQLTHEPVSMAAPGWLGMRMGGRTVTRIFPQSPAAQAGLREGDEVAEIDSHLLVTAAQLRDALSDVRCGAQVWMKVQREGQPVEAQMTAIDRQAYFKEHPAPADDLEAGIAAAELGQLGRAQDLLRSAAAGGGIRAQYELAQVAERMDFQRGSEEWQKFLALADAQTSAAWTAHAGQELKLLEENLGPCQLMKRAVEEREFDDPMLGLRLLHPVAIECSNYYFLRGYCLKQDGKYGEAARSFRTAGQLWLGDSTSRYCLAECFESFDLASAGAAYTMHLAMSSPTGSQKRLYAAAQQRLERVDAALNHKRLGDAQARAGRWPEALIEYETAAKSSPKSGEMLLARCRSLAKLGRDVEAMNLGQEVGAVGVSPATAAIHALMGDVCFQGRDFALAIREYGAAWDMSVGQPVYLYNKALAVERTWAKPLALLAWQGYLAQSQDDPAEAQRRSQAEARIAALGE